ncbi:MAG: matrixin family metalloprotease [Luteolibacter sp.]|uniref:matrixin family metalloprotease n=1 Tax=Luteolibacter sp. TaxID=1962973 RepID=UPI003267A561
MKKKIAPEKTAAAKARICFERILPDSLDRGKMVRRAMLHAMDNDDGLTLDPEAVAEGRRMALIRSKTWGAGHTLTCRFLDGSAKMKKSVEKYAKLWEKYANVKIEFVPSGTADVRISFYADDGSWSAVGTDSLNHDYFPLHQPTMNFGWVRDDTDADTISGVVLHEFGHALGCVHEHQSPEFERKWNTKNVYEYFQGPPNYWDPEDIKSNVLAKYPEKGIIASRFDMKSIMLYSFDAVLFSDHKGPTNENTTISKMDMEMIAKLYPKTLGAAKPKPAAKKSPRRR